MELCDVICPICFESFEVEAPSIGDSEFPVEHDYDCSVCCRPMLIVFEVWNDEVSATARGLGE